MRRAAEDTAIYPDGASVKPRDGVSEQPAPSPEFSAGINSASTRLQSSLLRLFPLRSRIVRDPPAEMTPPASAGRATAVAPWLLPMPRSPRKTKSREGACPFPVEVAGGSESPDPPRLNGGLRYAHPPYVLRIVLMAGRWSWRWPRRCPDRRPAGSRSRGSRPLPSGCTTAARSGWRRRRRDRAPAGSGARTRRRFAGR